MSGGLNKRKMDTLKSILAWFIAVGLLIILFPLTFIIWLAVLPFDRNRRVTHRILIWQSILISRLIPVWKIRITGRKNPHNNETLVLVSNHQSILDILVVNCLGYRCKWVSKVENMSVPVLGWYLRMADYIIVDRGNDESKADMLAKSLACLKRGCSVMLFPEGTRSRDGEPGFFKRGAFQLALQAGVPILPIVLDGTSSILPKHGLKLKSGKVYVRVLDPVMPDDFLTSDPDLLALRISNLMGTELRKLREENISR
jgi:1-acyl-sn-glycerol-3-phosphate acyltransferase